MMTLLIAQQEEAHSQQNSASTDNTQHRQHICSSSAITATLYRFNHSLKRQAPVNMVREHPSTSKKISYKGHDEKILSQFCMCTWTMIT